MTGMSGSLHQQTVGSVRAASLTSSLRFDWVATILSGALVGGVYLDGWAHDHGFVDQSFFTPWHGLMYGAMMLVALFLGGSGLRAVRRGVHWRRALPVGYGLSLLGVLLFAVGGTGDMIWHILFGIENDLEALLSPTHLVLALGWLLIVSGPLRAAWHRYAVFDRSDAIPLPALLSLTWLLSVLTFFTIYATPFGHAVAAPGAPTGEAAQALGVTGFLIQPALLMGLVLLALRRWRLPVGSLTLLLTLNTMLASTLHDRYVLVPAVALAGLLADALIHRAQPSFDRPLAVRVVAFGVPAIVYTLYFATLLLTDGIAWTVPLWTGAIVLAGVTGVLLSYAVVPPRVPDRV